MKLISPIVATVLLVVITVGITLFLWTFFQSYISSQTHNIPDICLVTTDIKCFHNNTHIETCIFQHRSGKNLLNVTIFLICDEPKDIKNFIIEKIVVGNISIISKLNMECKKDKTIIRVSGICEDYKTAQIIFECEGVRCFS